MAGTPEGKIKKMVNKVLDEFSDPLTGAGLYRYWPVPSGFGASSLDCIVCYEGVFLAIETKAPGKKPTPRQELCIVQIEHASGKVFVIDNEAGCELLRQHLRMIKNANDSKRQA